jgi:hypothetical protein
VTGKAALETEPIEVAFVGQGSLQPGGLALAGKGAVVSRNASASLSLIGLEAPPSATGIPVSLRFDVAKEGATIDLSGITGSIAGESVTGSVRLDQSGPKTRFSLDGSAGSMSLPSLLGVLVAWHRTPSTEELLGTISGNTSEVWPLRGFSLGFLEKFEGGISLKAKTLALGSAVKVQDAVLAASVGKEGLAVTDLKGRLFGGDFAASGSLAPRGNGAELNARAEVKGGKLGELAKSVTGTPLARGSFDLAFDAQGEGLSPPGVVAGLSGEGTFVLGPGTLQSLSASPLRGVAAAAARKTIQADKEAIEAEARSMRANITKGTYKFAPATFAFDIKNGTLTLAPATLTSPGAETTINGFVELASLKLDSEWAVGLTGAGAKDVPPITLVFTGPLNRAGEIAPAIDTGAIEAYLTMRRMQEDVERLETLDVSGRTPAAETETGGIATIAPEESPLETAYPSEPELVDPSAWTPETETSKEPASPPSATSATSLPSALELLQGTEEAEGETLTPATAKPETPASVKAATPPPAIQPEQQPAPVPEQAATTSPEVQPSAPATEAAKPPRKRSASKPRRQKPEAPDAWRKNVPIFGGG